MQTCLLDTHALIWATDPEHPSHPHVAELIAGAESVWVSSVSAWEIAAKTRLGKLQTYPDLARRFGEVVGSYGFRHLPLDYRHAELSGNLEGNHQDPFDRMLAAQSVIESVPLVTKDHAFEVFGTRTLW